MSDTQTLHDPVGARLAAAAATTTVLAPPGPPPLIGLIVVGTDGTPASDAAVAWAASMASATGARVLVVHVLTPNQALVRDFSVDIMRPWRRELDLKLRGAWTAPLRTASVNHRCLLIEDDSPAVGLTQLANQHRADLIVVGGKGGNRLAHGTTSDALAHHAGRPVVVVPASWHPADAAAGQDGAAVRP